MAAESPDRRAAQAQVADQAGPDRIAIRRPALVLAVFTLVFICVAATFLQFKTRSGAMSMSNLPLVALLPFVFWLLANVPLKRFCPRLSLSTAELRVLLCILWVGGSLAGYNWATQWVGVVTAPHYYASPENRWSELIFGYLPWWMYPTPYPSVIDGFYLGLESGCSWPWQEWIAPLFWAGSAALAMACIGLGISAVLHRQWAEHERLTFPLAQVALDLTDGFDRRPGWPPFVKNGLFWAGFTVAAIPLLWNIIEYWVPGFPRIAIFDSYFNAHALRSFPFSRHLWPFSYRLLPTVLGFLFLCDLNILFSLWSIFVAGQVALYGMHRVGFSVGLSGQEAKPREILGLFTHGATMALVVWAIWTARGHLGRVIRQAVRARREDRSETVFLSSRLALASIALGSLYMVFWLSRAGYSLSLAAVWLLLFWASILAVMKYLAASGFAYMFPNWGTSIPQIWLGTAGISEPNLVAMRVVNWRLLPGWRLPPVLPHVQRFLEKGRHNTRLVLGCVILGMLSAVIYTIWLCYQEGGTSFRVWPLVGAPLGMYNGIASVVAETDRTVADPAKIGVWMLGGGIAMLVTLLQTRLTWWPIHPLGFMLMTTGPVWRYVLDIFLVWLAKLLVLRFGGIALYRRARPFCYGLIIGYVFAVGCSFFVDYIWFPEGGHYIHGY